MIFLVILGVLVAWVLLSTLSIASYRGTLFILDRYGPGAACAFAGTQAALLFLALAW